MSDDNLNKLKKQRSAVRAAVTWSQNELQDEISQTEESNVSYLEELLETVISYYESLTVVDTKLE